MTISPKDPSLLTRVRQTLPGKVSGWQTVFFICLIFHFTCCLIGWSHSLLEHHSYRQCQVAIAIQYMLQDHAWIHYKTPVLGPPWQIPMEFPLFQMIVAACCLLLKSPIDQTGRAVSLLFFYASLWPMNLFLKAFVPERNMRFMILSLVLVAPVYIFFSRTVMIESTALFFGFCFLALSTRQVLRPTLPGMAALVFLGSVCALVKITTFCAFCFPALILLLLQRHPAGFRPHLLRGVLVLLPALALPLLSGMAWTRHADRIKLLNPLTASLTSSGMNPWNFGSLAQRLDLQTWSELLVKISFGLTFYPFLLLALLPALFLKNPARRLTGLFLLSVLLPVLVFFNLYLAHEYYFYACSVFLIFALGIVLAQLMRQGNKWGKLLWFGLSISFVFSYASFLLPKQLVEDSGMALVAGAVRENSGTDDIFLIYGDVWNSRLPYYSQRKGLANYALTPDEIQRVDVKMDQIAVWANVRLAVVNTDIVPIDAYLKSRLLSLGFPEKPDLVVNGFALYKKPLNR